MSQKWRKAARQAKKYGFGDSRASLRKVRKISAIVQQAHRDARGDVDAYVAKLETDLKDYT